MYIYYYVLIWCYSFLCFQRHLEIKWTLMVSLVMPVEILPWLHPALHHRHYISLYNSSYNYTLQHLRQHNHAYVSWYYLLCYEKPEGVEFLDLSYLISIHFIYCPIQKGYYNITQHPLLHPILLYVTSLVVPSSTSGVLPQSPVSSHDQQGTVTFTIPWIYKTNTILQHWPYYKYTKPARYFNIYHTITIQNQHGTSIITII